MSKKILIITIGLFVLAISIGGIILLSPKDNESSAKQLPSEFIKYSYCDTVSDCRIIAGYDADGCATCSENVGNIFDEQNYTFGKPSNSSNCPMLDCYMPPVNHLACVDNKCILVKNSTISDCDNNIQCLLIYAQENNDRSVCEKIKTLSPAHYPGCLFHFANSTKDCDDLAKSLSLTIDDPRVQSCFIHNAKIKMDCEFIKEAYEKNKCLAETATKIRECELIADTVNGRSWCYTRMADNTIPESIDDCNLLLQVRDIPINCINNFIKYNSEKVDLKESCYKLKNQKSVDYCLSQAIQY